jgi:uncharacterized protein (DUF2062 family)
MNDVSAPPMATAVQDPAPSFWRRRLLTPLRAVLMQGVTPDRLSFTLGLGAVCSLFPFLGTTTALNFAMGFWLRLNQPILQTLNQLLGPVQLGMILVYVRLGQVVWGASDTDRFSIAEMIGAFSKLSITDFLARFGWAGLHAFTAWAITAPVLLAAVYFPLRPVLRRLASRAGASGSR